MGCPTDISKNVIANCTVQGNGGNEVKGWMGQRKDFSFTYDITNPSKVTDITPVSGAQLFTITTTVKALDSGHDRVVEAGRGARFTHFIGFSDWEFDAASVENVDAMEDLFFIVEARDKADDADGTFRGYGLKYGLKPVTDSSRANDANGSRPLEFGPEEGDTEPHSQYNILDTDYATTAALLVSLETPAP